MSFQVRRADNRDVDDVVKIIRAVFDEYNFTWDEADYHADLYDLERHYDAEGGAFYVAESESQALGTIALGRFPTIPGEAGALARVDGFVRVAGCDCELNRLYVLPTARRMGVGLALMQQVVSAAHDDGRQAMEIWSDKRFSDAHRLYGRFGARTVGDRICHDPDQSPEWGLIVELQ